MLFLSQFDSFAFFVFSRHINKASNGPWRLHEWLVHNILLHTKINLQVMWSAMSSLYAPGPIRVIQSTHVGLQVETAMSRRGRDLIIPDAESIGHAQLIDANWKQQKLKIQNHWAQKETQAILRTTCVSDCVVAKLENSQLNRSVLCKFFTKIVKTPGWRSDDHSHAQNVRERFYWLIIQVIAKQVTTPK